MASWGEMFRRYGVRVPNRGRHYFNEGDEVVTATQQLIPHFQVKHVAMAKFLEERKADPKIVQGAKDYACSVCLETGNCFRTKAGKASGHTSRCGSSTCLHTAWMKPLSSIKQQPLGVPLRIGMRPLFMAG